MVTTINREVSLNTLQLSANSAQDQQHAASLLKLGKLVALPTETVYGLAADATQPEAVRQKFAAKGRPANHPLIVHIGSMDQLKDWAADVPERAITLAKAYWPGPLTFLMRKAEHVSSVVTGGLDTIALRMPAHPVILSLLKEHRLAVAAPSANPYKQLSPTNAEQVLSGLDGRIDAVVDGGDCLFGLESTIIDLTSETVRVLRAGPITAHDISTTLGEVVNYPQHHDVSVPGNVGSHYQPKTLLRLVDDIKQALSQRDKSLTYAVIHTTDLIHNEFTGNDIASIEMPNDATRYGNKLYRSLAEADKLQLDEIWLERPPQGEAWNAVNDRLSRAALPM